MTPSKSPWRLLTIFHAGLPSGLLHRRQHVHLSNIALAANHADQFTDRSKMVPAWRTLLAKCGFTDRTRGAATKFGLVGATVPR